MKKNFVISLTMIFVFLFTGCIAQGEESLRANGSYINFNISGTSAEGKAAAGNNHGYDTYILLTLQYQNSSGAWCYYASTSNSGREASISASITHGTYRLKAIITYYDDDGSVAETITLYSNTCSY